VAHAPFIGYQKTLKLLSLVIVDKVNIKSCSLEQICKSAARDCACASPRVHNNLRAIKMLKWLLRQQTDFRAGVGRRQDSGTRTHIASYRPPRAAI
jgi:hypothetical protein